MPASEFQKKKLLHLFNTFYDYNKDNVIEWVDFESCVDTICRIHEWDKNGERGKQCLKTLDKVWKGLQKYADKNKDNQITPDEWFQMWNECYAPDKPALPDWQLEYCNFFFDISDTSGDGIIDLDEYTKIYSNFGLSVQDCKDAFNKISDSGAKEITRTAYQALWNEYILSDDASARGNLLFGDLSKK